MIHSTYYIVCFIHRFHDVLRDWLVDAIRELIKNAEGAKERNSAEAASRFARAASRLLVQVGEADAAAEICRRWARHYEL
jgi:hypothetical protein